MGDGRDKPTPPEAVSGEVVPAQPRDERGLFLPGGGSLNPGGRPKALRELQESIRAKTPQLIDRLFDIALHGKPGNPTTVRAAEVLLERGYGKAPVTITDEDGNKMRVGIVILPATKGDGDGE